MTAALNTIRTPSNARLMIHQLMAAPQALGPAMVLLAGFVSFQTASMAGAPTQRNMVGIDSENG